MIIVLRAVHVAVLQNIWHVIINFSFVKQGKYITTN